MSATSLGLKYDKAIAVVTKSIRALPVDRIDEVTKLFGVNCRSIRHAYEPVLDSLVALSEQTTDPVMQYHFIQAMRD